MRRARAPSASRSRAASADELGVRAARTPRGRASRRGRPSGATALGRAAGKEARAPDGAEDAPVGRRARRDGRSRGAAARSALVGHDEVEHGEGRMRDRSEGAWPPRARSPRRVGRAPARRRARITRVGLEAARRRHERPAARRRRSARAERARAAAERGAERPRERARQRLEPLAEREESPRRGGAGGPRGAARRSRPRRCSRARAPSATSDGKRRGDLEPAALPAKIPATNGSTIRSATSGPSRRADEVAHALVAPVRRRCRRKGSARSRSLPARGEQPRAEQRRRRHRERVEPSAEVHVARQRGGSRQSASRARPSSSTSRHSSASAGRCSARARAGIRRGASDPDHAAGARATPRGRRPRVRRGRAPGPPQARRGRPRRRRCRSFRARSRRPTSARSASARRNVGRAFSPGVRRKCAIPAARACVAEELVDLVERLDVVGDERDRDDEDLLLAGAPELAEDVERRRPEPLDGPELRLVGERGGPGPAERARRIAATLASTSRCVRVALPVDELLRDRVRREERGARPRGAGRETARAPRGSPRRAPRRRAGASERSRTSTSRARGANRADGGAAALERALRRRQRVLRDRAGRRGSGRLPLRARSRTTSSTSGAEQVIAARTAAARPAEAQEPPRCRRPGPR